MRIERESSPILSITRQNRDRKRERKEEREKKRKRDREKKKQMSIIVCTQITNVNAILIKNEDLNFEIF